MSLNAKLIQIRDAFREHIRTPAQLWLLVRMLSWSIFLRLMRLILPVRWLVHFAVPSSKRDNVSVQDILRYLGWLEYSGLLARSDQCLIRSLVGYRYLSFAGKFPTLFIGFDNLNGHSWIEVAGKAILESELSLHRYRPMLFVPPGSRRLLEVKHSS